MAIKSIVLKILGEVAVMEQLLNTNSPLLYKCPYIFRPCLSFIVLNHDILQGIQNRYHIRMDVAFKNSKSDSNLILSGTIAVKYSVPIL